MNIRKVIYRRWICLLLSIIAAFLILPQYIPQVQILSRSVSPDGEWEAVTQNEDYGITIFDPQYNSVILKPRYGLWRLFKSQKVLMIAANSDTNIPHVQWNDSNELVISLNRFDITYVDRATASTYAVKPLGICLQTIDRLASPDKRYTAILEDWRYKDATYYNLRLVTQDSVPPKQEITLNKGSHSPDATPPQIIWKDKDTLLFKKEQKDFIEKKLDTYQGIKITLHWNEN